MRETRSPLIRLRQSQKDRVRDILIETPMSRFVRAVTGKPSVQELLGRDDTELRSVGTFRRERNFQTTLWKAEIAYFLSFDPAFVERQAIVRKLRAPV